MEYTTVALRGRNVQKGLSILMHWGRGKMTPTLQTTVSNIILLNENSFILIQIALKFVHKGPFAYKRTSIASDHGLVPNRRQAMIWTNTGPVYNASLYLDELMV